MKRFITPLARKPGGGCVTSRRIEEKPEREHHPCVTTTQTLGQDLLEASRSSVVAGSPQVTALRTVNTRDVAKRLTKATLDTSQSATDILAQYEYDGAGHLVKQWGPDSGNGSGYLSAAPTTTAYTYNTTSGLKTNENLQLMSVGTAGVISSTYTYTSAGRLYTATTGGVTETYSYDAAGNLTGDGTRTYTYSENRLSTQTGGGQSTYFFFDTSKRWRTVQAPTNNPSDLNRTEYAYLGNGRLSGYVKYVSGSPSVTAAYSYDSIGQRYRSAVTYSGQSVITTEFAYQGLLLQSLSASQVGTGATTWKITYLYDEYGRPYGGVYRSPATSTAPVFFGMVVTDRGDVVKLLDAAGAPFAAYRYDAWGNPQGTGTDGVTGVWWKTTTVITDINVAKAIAQRQPLRYASYCFDSESGMYYLSSRHYDPKTRQFLSKDLSRNDGEQSAYQYCLGNPVAGTDPTGYAVVRESGRPLTPQERADTKNRMMAARARWYASHSQSTAGKIFGWMNKYLNPVNAAKNLGSKIINKASSSLGIGYDWAVGTGSRNRYYDAYSEATGDMMNSKGVQQAWGKFVATGCNTMPFDYASWDAAKDTVIEPNFGSAGKTIMTLANPLGALFRTFDDQAAVVNGYATATAGNGWMGGIIRNNGDQTATVTIRNVSGLESFCTGYNMLNNYLGDKGVPPIIVPPFPPIGGDIHIGNVPWSTGPLSSITQTYEWTVPLPAPYQ